MRIFIDADAFPAALREIIIRTSQRRNILLVVVANRHIRFPEYDNMKNVFVSGGPDAADDYIAEHISKGEIVITFDIPLAHRVVKRGGFAISPRGELFEERNINQKLALRNLMEELRNTGLITGGPPVFSQKDREAFANQLNKFLDRYYSKAV
ncbi:MAG TPA: YaiI/YqxD family protein [Lentisphaeria bacterium]|nr:MAG: hypothetical protein A2X47_01790 [Lentisphaerae bacterium GWF2_38_69]HBM15664.1 YaiI/YqxD family protein [Lentisphaeria bacterium]